MPLDAVAKSTPSRCPSLAKHHGQEWVGTRRLASRAERRHRLKLVT
jgi:hypothetical protein